MAVLIAGLAAPGSGSAFADVDRSPRIIRPPDDRLDYFATTAALRAIGDSVCAQIAADMITDNGNGTFTIAGETLADQFNPLCDGERFGNQPAAANCTATLIGPDVVITAGHCLDENGVRTDLSTLYFVFDYAVRQEGVNPSTFNADQVYRPTTILGCPAGSCGDRADTGGRAFKRNNRRGAACHGHWIRGRPADEVFGQCHGAGAGRVRF
jgi:hypothetical protein